MNNEFAEREDSEALSISKGVAEKNIVNPNVEAVLAKRRRKEASVEELFNGILSGNRTALAQGITLVESSLPEHQSKAQELIQKCLPHSGNSLRIGITGSPGAGKSSFIEAFGVYLIEEHNKKIAVLAIDPTSQRTKGSILGDKTRMNFLSAKEEAFIRPSPSGSSLGGVAQKTRESIILCEAAGYPIILIETVGVGQSETAVHGMTDFFLLLMLAGAGDELQGIKRGIMEMCDGMAITKCDGENVAKAMAARSQYQSALHLFPANPYNWMPKVIATSSVSKEGLPETWKMISDFETLVKQNGWFFQNRKLQQKSWMESAIHSKLMFDFYNHPAVQKELPATEQAVVNGKESPFKAANRLLSLFSKNILQILLILLIGGIGVQTIIGCAKISPEEAAISAEAFLPEALHNSLISISNEDDAWEYFDSLRSSLIKDSMDLFNISYCNAVFDIAQRYMQYTPKDSINVAVFGDYILLELTKSIEYNVRKGNLPASEELLILCDKLKQFGHVPDIHKITRADKLWHNIKKGNWGYIFKRIGCEIREWF